MGGANLSVPHGKRHLYQSNEPKGQSCGSMPRIAAFCQEMGTISTAVPFAVNTILVSVTFSVPESSVM